MSEYTVPQRLYVVKSTTTFPASNAPSLEREEPFNHVYLYREQSKRAAKNRAIKIGVPIDSIELVENAPTKGLSLATSIGWGSRAPTLIYTAEGWAVEVSMHDLFENMATAGIEPGGNFSSEMVWAMRYLQMVPIPFQGKNHQQAINDHLLYSLPPYPQPLEVGGIYQMSNGETYLYLGSFETVELDTSSGSRAYFDRAPTEELLITDERDSFFDPTRRKTIELFWSLHRANSGPLPVDLSLPTMDQLLHPDAGIERFQNRTRTFVRQLGYMDVGNFIERRTEVARQNLPDPMDRSFIGNGYTGFYKLRREALYINRIQPGQEPENCLKDLINQCLMEWVIVPYGRPR